MRMIITGAASGIGKAVATLGAQSVVSHLLLVDLRAGPLEEAAEEISRGGAAVRTLAVDLSRPESCVEAVRVARSEFGGLDSVVSNAGTLSPSSLCELSVDAFDHAFHVNTRPTWLLGKAAYPLLVESKGSIVATASIAASHAVPNLGAYSPSKAALLMLVRQMALEWGPDGIRCNCVSPGPTYTEMTRHAYSQEDRDAARSQNRRAREAAVPLRKLGTPNEVATVILFLAGAGASHVTGINIDVDGGLSVALMPNTGGGLGYQP